MKIIIITPAKVNSLSGNRATAIRWATLLEQLGHTVNIDVQWDGQPYDLMLALHAWRSADSINQFRKKYPQHPLIVALTGTDAYRFIHSHKETTLKSIEQADIVIGLHDLIANTLPEQYQHKVHVIYQSATNSISSKDKDNSNNKDFHLCVAGHLRDEKDPLRPAMAIRDLPDKSRIQLSHYGKAHTPEWAEQAKQEMQINPRYHWYEEISQKTLHQEFQKSQLLVLPSRMEGGANVISEAVVAGLPIIASNIEGSIGLLGKDYPGYYEVGDTTALRKLLLKAESDARFYKTLVHGCKKKRDLFTPE